MLMERAVTNSISPSIFTSLFMPHPGEPEETGEKALKMKRGPNPVGFSREGLQNSRERSSPGLPCALTRVSNPVEPQAVLRAGLGSHCPPSPSKGSSRLSPEPICARSGHGTELPSCHCFPFDVAAGGTARTRCSLRLHTGSALRVTGHPGRAAGAGKAPGTAATAGPNGSPEGWVMGRGSSPC